MFVSCLALYRRFLSPAASTVHQNLAGEPKLAEICCSILSPPSSAIEITYGENLPLGSADVDEWVANLLAKPQSSPTILGLDCEWQPQLKSKSKSKSSGEWNKTAVLQIGNRERCLVLRVLHYSLGQLPPAIVQLLEDPLIVKTGVNIHGDCQRLFRDFGVRCQCVLDLRSLEAEMERTGK